MFGVSVHCFDHVLLYDLLIRMKLHLDYIAFQAFDLNPQDVATAKILVALNGDKSQDSVGSGILNQDMGDSPMGPCSDTIPTANEPRS